MATLFAYLDGKKTYIAMGAGALYGVLITAGVVQDKASVWSVIGSLTVIGLRSWGTKLVQAWAAGKVPVLVQDAVETPPTSGQ